MFEIIVKRLFSVKSLVTLTLTGVFSYLAIVGKIDGQEFLTIFTVIISFYFGTQSQKREDEHEPPKQTLPSDTPKESTDISTEGWDDAE